MQKRRKVAAIIAATMVVGNTGVSAEKGIELSENTYREISTMFDYFVESAFLSKSILLDSFASTKKLQTKEILKAPMKMLNASQDMVTEAAPISMPDLVEEQSLEATMQTVQYEISELIPEPRYGVDFTRIRERFPNKLFVKKVLTDEMQEHLNKREAETGIPGAAIIAQGIWEVGWNLSTAKSGGRDSMNLFNIKNCDGNYVVMAGAKWQCYNSYIESVDGYIELITTMPRYAKAYEYIKSGGDIATYYRMLGDAGYYEANKDTYVKNCMSIINANKLLAK